MDIGENKTSSLDVMTTTVYDTQVLSTAKQGSYYDVILINSSLTLIKERERVEEVR